VKGVVKMADEYSGHPLGKARLRKGLQQIQRQRFPKGRVGLFQTTFDGVYQVGPHRQPPDNRFRDRILGQSPEGEIVSIVVVDAIAVAKKMAFDIPPPGKVGTPRESRGVAADEKKFVVAFNEADAAMRFLPAAPGQKGKMLRIFITRQGNPEIEDVTEKNHIPRTAFQGGQHVKKSVAIRRVAANVRIRNHDQRHGVFIRRDDGAMRFAIHPIQSKVCKMMHHPKEEVI
jgi:hypothetical protein